jgi:mRNA interferase RelE/StbE
MSGPQDPADAHFASNSHKDSAYAVVFESGARREMKKLPPDPRRRLEPAVLALANDPRPRGCKKLTGSLDLWRIRVGDYRMVYRIQDDELLVIIVRVGNRSEVYD